LLTAAVGLYATLSFAVNQRTHEIGVRVALGAEAGNIGRLLIRDALGPVLLGIAAGLVAATWLSKFIGSQLFHVRPHDVTTYVAVVILLVIMCAVAALAPVARASRIDPADALRNE
jgi:ABC-type antimicrobial peptide transport system permease subunit